MKSRPWYSPALITALISIAMLAQTNLAESLDQAQIGLQLYSLRDQLLSDVPATLEEVRSWGLTNVELAGTYNLTPEQFRAELDNHGLHAFSGHFPYERFRDDVEGLAHDAKILGLKYVGCAWIPHDDNKPFDEQTCRDAIAVFNRAGEALARHGIKFFYHVHGYEFQPYANGTLLDLMMQETNPRYVHYEMDVFWIVHPGQDPVKLLVKYGHRWQLMHLKGMRDSTPTGLLTGHSAVTNDVALGTGKIDYLPILQEAHKLGIRWYIIEDESPLSEQQVPQSFQYLKSAQW